MTGSRTIHAENLKDIRIMITKSHPVRTGQLVEGVDEVTAELQAQIDATYSK